jgi:hypothetical protein
MRKLLFVLILILIPFGCDYFNVSLADYLERGLPVEEPITTPGGDEDDKTYLTNDASFLDIIAELKASGEMEGTITLSEDIVMIGSDEGAINLTAGNLPSGFVLTIDGNGHTFSAGEMPPERVFYLHGYDYTIILKNMTITGGNATSNEHSNGGAIHLDNGILILENVTIEGNKSAIGGGIWAKKCDLTLIDVDISHNEAIATNSGNGGTYGGLYKETGTTITITGGSITGNSPVDKNF